MLIFKCKMCGGSLNIEEGNSVATCDYCGTKQTLPKLNDDRRANLYDRANHFRRNNEFDKAMGIYEQILAEDNTDSEAYWSRVLCRYGIEYVEDSATKRRVPTVNRAQYTSIFDDADYKAALEYGDLHQRKVYEEEAKAINEIQKAILAISQEEDAFDVFICYKETDDQGRRTPDSVLSNDLYHQLTREGFKVFFSRITLEDKLGSAYEPYIFAALNSAKVMVVIGTKAEYFNAVWVRNEWSRYLTLIKGGSDKILIPAYRDMDPYDLPEEFSHLQAQDMSKLGFMQDLIRGIKKITATESAKPQVTETVVVGAGSSNIKSLLDRASLFLEDGDWASADQYCERVLDQDPRNALAYLGKLMAEFRVKHQEGLADCAEPFEENSNYQKAARFADDNLKATLIGYNKSIRERNEHNRLDAIYNDAKMRMDSASTEEQYK
ncbi:MAG: toll/interleukin-1 receptor domain-containing protein, partial [Fastidiosipila sp.]|nr:toll/interleukin-1 receptor domain-containing protein [Fastidiosipila sp.]